MKPSAVTTKQRLLCHSIIGQFYLATKHGWDSRVIQPYFSIPGWLDVDEALALFRIARHCVTIESPVVVEIGSFQGKSSVVLAKALQLNPAARVYCIDPFQPTGDANFLQTVDTWKRDLPTDYLQTFSENLERAGVRHLVVPRKGLSHEVSKTWATPIDFLFIDGNHDYEAVRRDFLEWTPHLKRGGYLAFHDVFFNDQGVPEGFYTGPAQVVKESIQGNSGWLDQQLVASLYLTRKS